MVKEIGGYFELEHCSGQEYYSNAIPLNCGRNALAYLVEARRYKKVYVPAFCCGSVERGLQKGGASCERYEVDECLHPAFDKELQPNEAVLFVNYYGQLSNEEILAYKKRWGAVIADNSQAFFQYPVDGVDTIYSCRKFFGVADGAYLATEAKLGRALEEDVSAKRMLFVLGRYDENASAYYKQASENNTAFDTVPIRFMSKLTHNLLRGIDYEAAKIRRRENATYLHERLGEKNQLSYRVPDGAFMYPFYGKGISGRAFRRYLQEVHIYVPCLWPDVLQWETEDSLAYRLADEIVPLPCDQRYGREEMEYIVDKVKEFLKRNCSFF